jgi:putative redox protein
MPLLTAALTDPDYGFDVTDQSGHNLRLDIPAEQGGGGTGYRPMQILLAGLIGCSGVDVVSILKKQKQSYEGLQISVDGEREQGKDISLWQEIRLEFRLTGSVEPAKAWRAVSLSIDKYCSVAETLRRAGATIRWKVFVNDQEVLNA